MAKHEGTAGKGLVRVNAAATGAGLMRRIGPRGVEHVTLPHAPAEVREQAHAPHAAKRAKKAHHGEHGGTKKRPHKGKHHGGGHHGGGGHHTLTDAQVVQIVLAALQGGPLLLAVQDIVLQVFWQLQAEQQSAMHQGGSYQRMGGF